MRARRSQRVAAVVCFGLIAATELGCGWHPAQERNAPATLALREIVVGIIPERNGQLLREALIERLQGSGSGTSPRYILSSSYQVSLEGIGIQSDSSVTRFRLVAVAQFNLRSLSIDQKTCVAGQARSVQGVDAANQQFFASDLAVEQASRLLASDVADAMVAQIDAGLQRAGVGCLAG